MAEAQTPEPRPYQRVYADLRARIERGELPEGTQLPSQPTLAGEYGVALLTVRHAIDLLRRAGYVSVEHGRGTFVTGRGGGDTILVVDDDPLIRRLIATTLEDVAGFELVEAEDGIQALERAQDTSPAIVFLDIDMPRMDGITACAHLRAAPETSDATIVMLTAVTDDSAERRASEAGADLFLTKPFSPLDLLRLVDRIGERFG